MRTSMCLRWTAAAAIAIFTVSCNDDDEGVSPSPGGGTTAQDALSDGQVAFIINAVNLAEIEQAQIAMERAAGAGARAYAQRMLTDHLRANAELQTLVDSLGISFEESQQRQQVMTMAGEHTAQLHTASPAAFDAYYVRTQVVMHDAALDLMQTQLVDEIEDQSMLGLASELQAAVASHLAGACQLWQGYPGGVSGIPGEGGTVGGSIGEDNNANGICAGLADQSGAGGTGADDGSGEVGGAEGDTEGTGDTGDTAGADQGNGDASY